MVIPNKFENFAYFGTNYSTLWVNTNGAFSFRTAISTFTPSCSPLNVTYSMVAPYWADVDISMTGHIYYRQTQNSTILAKAKDEINNAFPHLPNINLTWAFIATWYNVTYYPDNSDYYYRKRDIFQATLVSNGAQSFAIFYYNQILWTTGDTSGGNNGLGGTPAFAGFDAGDGQDRYTIPGSCTADIINIANETNCGKPGVFVFRIDNSTIIQPSTTTTTTTQINSTPRPTTIYAPSAPPTTRGSTSTLSNSDGTPCNCDNSGLWLDLILVIDRSAGVGSDGLSAIGGQLLAILDNVPVAQSGQGDFYTRVGLVVYSSDVQVVSDLTHYQSFDDLMMDLINLNQYHKANDRIADIGK
uniref:NIDO domain-containing protein n=1 Tax=Acrobeloides nanus TaxID=290746 RepID=A0A914EJY0_9BILA